MDAREALRRYLEQRRDAGERELVLDSLTVDDALRLLGVPSASSLDTRSPRVLAPLGARLREGPARPGEPDRERGGDWRATLRAAGAAPESAARAGGSAPTPGAIEPPGEVLPRSERGAGEEGSVSPLADVPGGIVVGRGGRERTSSDDPAAGAATLDEVAARIASCTRCPLAATARNPVPGAGSATADLMCVGEAPGASEDEEGVPFVGASGQLLTKILAAIGLSRGEVFIANVLKHRPPGNRNPTPEEVTACAPYLVRQIEIVRPRVILALGTFAAQTLLQTRTPIGKLRGQVHRYYGVSLVVTYHPAALLRNPAWKRPTWEDVQLARRILDRALASGA